MNELDALRENLKSLQTERTRISAEGDALFNCWLCKSLPAGTAKTKNYHWQLKSSAAQFNGKKSRYIKASEASEVAAAIARGKRLRELEKNIAELQQRLTKIEKLLGG